MLYVFAPLYTVKEKYSSALAHCAQCAVQVQSNWGFHAEDLIYVYTIICSKLHNITEVQK